jgi:hypothetical protein
LNLNKELNCELILLVWKNPKCLHLLKRNILSSSSANQLKFFMQITWENKSLWWDWGITGGDFKKDKKALGK